MKRILSSIVLGVAAGYAIHLLRNIAVNTAMLADLLGDDAEEEILDCGCNDAEWCELCRLPPDDDDFQLGDQDEREFRGIIDSLDPEENTDG